jgi:hypothetical protein
MLRLVAVLSIVGAFAVPVAGTAAAGAMTPATTIIAECDNAGQNSFLCLTKGGNFNGARVNGKTFDNSKDQNFTAPFLNICNGDHVVTATCPFKHASMDRQLVGDNIRKACFATAAGCIGLSGTKTVVQGTTGGNGTTWITAGKSWVNRLGSDNAGKLRYLNAPASAGGQCFVGEFRTGRSQWETRRQ